MQRFPWLPVVLCAAIIVSGCEGQTVQQSVRATIEALKVDNTAIDEQSSLVGLNENAVKAAEKTTEAKDEEEKEEEITAKPISPDRARFQAYVKTAAFTIRLREAAISTDAYLGRDCDSAYQTTLLSVLHQPEPALSMPEASEHPVSGIWRTRYRLERCGETLIYNAIFGGKADGPANMRISMPGNTATGSALAREIRADIKDSALERADMKRCTDQRIVDTQAEAPLKEAESDGSVWTKLVHEVWSIDVCGRLVDIALHHGFRDGVGYRQYLIEAIDAPLWRPSGRSVPKDIDLPRLQTALQQVITGKASASLDYLWAEARREVPFAQTVIAGLLRDGDGVERNIDRAAFWALRAAYGGYPGAMELVGDIYDSGSWIVRDQRLAAAWYRRAAKRGSDTAKAKLAALQSKAKNDQPVRPKQ